MLLIYTFQSQHVKFCKTFKLNEYKVFYFFKKIIKEKTKVLKNYADNIIVKGESPIKPPSPKSCSRLSRTAFFYAKFYLH